MFLRRAGVCVFVRDDICCRRLHGFEAKDLSLLWLRVDHGGSIRVYACLYRSHSGDSETTRLFEHIASASDKVLEMYPSAELAILGDFNAHHQDWLGSKSTDHAGRMAHELATTYSLTQVISGPTRIPDIDGHEPSLLDLVLASHPCQYSVNIEPPLGSSDHCLIRTEVPNSRPNSSHTLGKRQVWHYSSADWDGLREFFSSYPWKQICFLSDDPSKCAESVGDVVLQGMECFIPNSLVRLGGGNQPWYNRLCTKAANRKLDAFKVWSEACANNDPDVSAFKKHYNYMSRRSKKTIAKARNDHIGRIGDKLASYPSGSRAFWSLAKAAEMNFCQTSLPALRKPDNTLAHSAKEKADLLCSLFAANSTMDDGNATPPVIPSCGSSMPGIRISQKLVRKELRALDVRKSSGPDGIPAIVLNKCAPELAPVFARLFSLSYTTGIVPSSWKVALVHPIPKKGDRTDPSNYRPIAITSLLSKVMERVINTQLLRYLEEHQLISDRQYGFRHGRSAGDLLVYLTHRWADTLESKGESLAVSLDIAKAFDRVWHRALLSKLPSYGLPVELCTWIADFLSGRSIKAVVDGSSSETMTINAGVPQGSVLSPTLFILHINDMLQISNIHCYADDSTCDASCVGRPNAPRNVVEESRQRLVSDIEGSLGRISDWGNTNLVTFNPTKTQVCAFSAKKTAFNHVPRFQGIPLTISANLEILGVDISNEVQFRRHLENKAGLASKKLGVLNRAKRYFTSGQRLLLYKAQVRPHMEYCSHLWNGAPKYQLQSLDAVQRRAVRITDNLELTKCLEPLSLRRDIGALSVFYKIYNGECSEELFGLIPASRFHHRTARHRLRAHPHVVDVWGSRTTRFTRSFLPHTCRLWNDLPGGVFPLEYNMGVFKRRTKKVLMDRQRVCNSAGVADVYRRR